MDTKIRNTLRPFKTALLSTLMLALIAGCGGGGGGDAPPTTGGGGGGGGGGGTSQIDTDLRTMINQMGLTGDPSAGRNLPDINDPIPQLGKLLFFSKSLSGDLDTACASCHHPALGGGDALALPIGVGATDPDLLGPGRSRPDGLPNVGRHSQSVFNVGLYDKALFWDSRVESLGADADANGTMSGIRTPESALGVADAGVPTGASLPAAQARLPVAVVEEMRGSLMPGASDDDLRAHLAERIGDYGAGTGALAGNGWLAEFQTAFSSSAPAQDLVTFDNIAFALAEYQRSMVFVDTPWRRYVEGDNAAISTEAKEGALLFYGDTSNQGFNCASCHGGDFFTDERNMLVGFPQSGIGKGDGAAGDHDFGREQQSGDVAERFFFRTPTLLNIEATAPYGHTGTFDLIFALQHYFLPLQTLGDALPGGSVCEVPQFADNPDCATLFPNTLAYSQETFAAVTAQRMGSSPELTFPDLNFSPTSDAPKLLAFIQTLTDPCTLDRACLVPWIPDAAEAPDAHQLNAIDENGNAL